MTTSDIERTLAEARAAAARRLEALRRAESEAAPQAQREAVHAGPSDPVIIPQREPVAYVGQAAPEIAVAPHGQGDRHDQPGAVAPTIAPYEVQSAPLVAHAAPIPTHEDAVQADDLQYTAYEPVGAPRDPSRTAGYVPVDPLPPRTERRDATVGYEDAYPDEPAGKPGLMAGLVAGVAARFAAYRRSRAERRALARENALQSADLATGQPRNQRLTAREQRWERRRKRHLFEEILGWILVPIILVAVYFFVIWILDLFGTTPDALIEGMQTIWSQFR